MDINKTYSDIVIEYTNCRSITKIAKKLGVSEERVRRTLITEGLWISRSAKPIVKLFQEGKSVPEIAETLMISEKTVQSYIPYSKGMYGGEKSDTAQRSEEYRERMRKAIGEMMSNYVIPDDKLPEIITNKKWDVDKLKFKRSDIGKKPWEILKDSIGDERKYVYKLRFDLVSNQSEDIDRVMTNEEYKEFLKLSKANHGISRTVLVPGEMDLHAMHYMIQQLFGWQNEHPHCFALSDQTFTELTCGNTEKWIDMCGVVFRFPGSRDPDIYYDDDYKANQSVKTWLRSKYCGSNPSKATSDSFVLSLLDIEDSSLKSEDLLHQIGLENDYNTLVERLRVCDLFISSKEIYDELLAEWKNKVIENRNNMIVVMGNRKTYVKQVSEIYEAINQLYNWRLLRRTLDNAIISKRRIEVEKYLGKKIEEVLKEADKAIDLYEANIFGFLNAYNPKIYPFTDKLYYRYDFGDDWCIKISCEKRYMRMDEWDFPDKNGFILARTLSPKDGLRTYRYFDETEAEIIGDERNILAEVDVMQFPRCIAADGFSLVEDVGGIRGFYEMLKKITSDNIEEKKDIKKWVSSLGWTGRIKKPELML